MTLAGRSDRKRTGYRHTLCDRTDRETGAKQAISGRVGAGCYEMEVVSSITSVVSKTSAGQTPANNLLRAHRVHLQSRRLLSAKVQIAPKYQRTAHSRPCKTVPASAEHLSARARLPLLA